MSKLRRAAIMMQLFPGTRSVIPRSRRALPFRGRRLRNESEQTKLPPLNTPGNKNLGQLVGAAKAVLGYYGPVVDELSVEARERNLFHRLENALAPFLREAAARGGSINPQSEPHRAKIYTMPKPEPIVRELASVQPELKRE
jgi:hypothetical protein